jgi:hypothetical protein
MTKRETETTSGDPNALVQEALRESYRQNTEDLRYYAEKVHSLNESKKALRAYLSALRSFKATVISAAHEGGIDLCRGDKKDLAVLARLFQRHAHVYKVGEIDHSLCIPDRVPASGVNNLALLDATIAHWEGRLASIGDDAQLANVDLQNVLQKQQQTLQMMSNISKMIHDTAMAIIRKIGG